MHRSVIGCCIAVWLILSLPTRADDSIATWTFSGVVNGVFDFDGALDGAISVGDPLTGTVSFDLSTLDSNPNLNAGDYFSAISTVMGELGDVPFQGHVAGPRNMIAIRNFEDRNDTVALTMGVSFLDIVTEFQFGFEVDPSVLTSDDLPKEPPVLTGNLGGDFLFVSKDEGTAFKIVGTINAIPEPATLVLLALSSGAVLLRVRRRR